jgi:hypothetical protein
MPSRGVLYGISTIGKLKGSQIMGFFTQLLTILVAFIYVFAYFFAFITCF